MSKKVNRINRKNDRCFRMIGITYNQYETYCKENKLPPTVFATRKNFLKKVMNKEIALDCKSNKIVNIKGENENV